MNEAELETIFRDTTVGVTAETIGYAGNMAKFAEDRRCPDLTLEERIRNAQELALAVANAAHAYIDLLDALLEEV